MTHVLLVEDDLGIAQVIGAALSAEGMVVDHCETLAARDRMLARGGHALLITDVKLGDGDGIETLARVREVCPDLPVIVLSAQNTLDTAVRAADALSFEYFPKPFDLDELVAAVREAVRRSDPAGQDSGLPDPGAVPEAMPLVGRSMAMQGVYRTIARLLSNDLTVLVLGESGTGKELVAEAIHRLGQRKAGPFVAVNMAAIPAELIESELFGHEKGAFTGAVARTAGKFEQAGGGTLFLDEIGDMPLDAQTRLLRALQSGRIRRVGGSDDIALDVRIVAATNRDLQALVDEGRFREDLFYRINVVPVSLPPLRDRREDIEALALHFAAMAAGEGLPRRSFTPDAVALLAAQPWRGNVRELKNVVYRAVVLARQDRIDADALRTLWRQAAGENPAPPDAPFEQAVLQLLHAGDGIPDGDWYQRTVHAVERPLLVAAMARAGGNQLRAAEILGINRNTLRKKLQDHGLAAERDDPSRTLVTGETEKG